MLASDGLILNFFESHRGGAEISLGRPLPPPRWNRPWIRGICGAVVIL